MSNNVKERSYSHQVVHPICDLLLYGIPKIDQEFDGEAQSTKNHNGGLSGPDRRPDVMMSRIYDQLKAEMVFVEISYGPYSRDENHYRDDKVRLGKFSKDAWRHIQAYFGQFKCPETLRRLDELEHFSIHFHGTRMDVYVSDRKLALFHRMCLIRSLEIPLTNEDPSSMIKAVTELCETLLTLNSSISCNFELLDSVVREIQNITPTTPPYKQNNSIPTNVTPSSRDRPYLV